MALADADELGAGRVGACCVPLAERAFATGADNALRSVVGEDGFGSGSPRATSGAGAATALGSSGRTGVSAAGSGGAEAFRSTGVAAGALVAATRSDAAS